MIPSIYQHSQTATRWAERRRSQIAFSLVEIVIALGVAVVVLVGIFALLQSSLGTFRDAKNSTITSSIGQQMLSQYLLADFEKITALPVQTNYYDERGLPISESAADHAIYCSTAKVLEDSSILGIDQNNLLRVQIIITSPTQPSMVKAYTCLIGRLGKLAP